MPLDNTPTDTLKDSELVGLTPETKVMRRMFVAGATMSTVLALSVRPANAAMIKTPMDGLRGGIVKAPAADGSIPAYMAMPATSTNHPEILVVQEIIGIHEHIKDGCRRVAKQGHLAIALEMYHRQGDASKYNFKQIR